MPGNESTPSLSPDGKWVAFASDATGNRDIWIKNLDGGEPIRLTTDPAEDYDPAWSPDGSTIAFRSNRAGGGLYAMPAFSGEAVRLVDFGFRPRWSPDGSKLLFQLRAFDFIPNEVYVMGYRPRSEPEVVLDFVSDGDPFNQAEWSPDGTRLMYHTGSYIAGAGIAVRSLKPPGTESFVRYQDDAKVNRPDPIWTPDGRGLISSGQGSLLYLPFDSELRVTQAPTQLTTGSPSTPHRAPSLSRDGSRLAFSGAASQSDIWKVAMDPATGMPVGTPVRVIAHPSNDLNPTLLPDGKHILFASDRDGAYHIYVADTAGANVRLVDSSNPVRRGGINSLSPDGRWLLVTSPNLRQHLVPFDPDRIEVLGPWRDFEVAGQKGAYRSWSWSPDGRRVTATTTQERSWTGITIIDDPTGEAPRDSVWPIDPRFIEQYPNRVRGFFSPDGEWVTFGAYKDRDKPSVFTVRRGSTEPQLLWTGSGFNDWMDPDRIHIWGEAGYENEDRLGFVDIDRATGKPTGGLRILDLRPARGTINIYEAALTKDHRWLFFGFTETEGDIYVGDVRSGR
jgi:Tol biopolymer transport system component